MTDTTVAFVLDLIGDDRVATQRMFGATALMCDGRMVALLARDRLFVKPTDAGRSLLGAPEEQAPCRGLGPWFVVPADRWDDGSLLPDLIRTTAAALPPAGPKRARKPRRVS